MLSYNGRETTFAWNLYYIETIIIIWLLISYSYKLQYNVKYYKLVGTFYSRNCI